MTANLQELAPKHISVRVPAKINLSLKVAPLGEDDFHQLATVFHAVSIYDEVTVSMVNLDKKKSRLVAVMPKRFQLIKTILFQKL